jgi:hypothetical protein
VVLFCPCNGNGEQEKQRLSSFCKGNWNSQQEDESLRGSRPTTMTSDHAVGCWIRNQNNGRRQIQKEEAPQFEFELKFK